MSDHGDKPAYTGLHFPVNVRSLPPKGLQLELKTDARERNALAEAHGLAAVRAFSAVFHVRPWKKQGARVEGQIEAHIEQQCIITAEPVQNSMRKHFEAYFVPQNSRLAKLPGSEGNNGELLLDPEGADAPEIFSGSEIDVGLLAEEFFELEIDRYPRKKEASLDNIWPQGEIRKAGDKDKTAQEEKAERPASPFAVLTHLKKH